MISCRRATELISKQLEEPLSLMEVTQLKLHLFICEYCEKFREQSVLVRGILSRLCRGETETGISDSPQIKDSAKQRIKEVLKKKLGEPEQ